MFICLLPLTLLRQTKRERETITLGLVISFLLNLRPWLLNVLKITGMYMLVLPTNSQMESLLEHLLVVFIVWKSFSNASYIIFLTSWKNMYACVEDRDKFDSVSTLRKFCFNMICFRFYLHRINSRRSIKTLYQVSRHGVKALSNIKENIMLY